MIQTWRLDTPCQTMVLGAVRNRLASVIYWGKPLPSSENLEQIWHAHEIDVTGGQLDENPELSICPEATRTFPGQPGLNMRSEDAKPVLPKFCFDSEDVSDTKLVLRYRDAENGLLYTASFVVNRATNVIVADAALEAKKPIHLLWLSAPTMPAPQNASEMIDFSGRWCGEFQTERSQWRAGMRYRENRTGRTGHEHFPGLIIPCECAKNTAGETYAFHYGWSGGHKMIAEELPDGRRQVQFGHAARMEIDASTNFKTAPLYLTYSDSGLNGCARSFQRHVRDEIVKFPKANRQRPVHYNCWEAVYFDHNLDELKEIATLASSLGAERFVLDDGWFGSRDDDTRALSEWEVDVRKYPDGLAPLIDHIHKEGMSFGIWFEPEMINPESTVYKTNPHWALGSEDQILGRNQKALNMALPEVHDFLFERIGKVLADHDVDYIKWDHNRVLPSPDAAQTRGSYALLDRLRESFPNVEIESCASGGGRIDYGILARTHRVWLSDSNDAAERAKIQHNAALFLPANITGSHVGPRLCHTSGRVLSMSFRAWVAAQRHMGFEMDPRELNDEEAATLRQVTSWWKDNRDWMMRADILRLDNHDPAVVAEQHLSDDGGQFVAFINKIDTSAQIAPRPICFTGLKPEAMYEIELLNREEHNKLSRGAQKIKFENLKLSGSYLMSHGVTLPWSFPFSTWVLKGTLS